MAESGVAEELGSMSGDGGNISLVNNSVELGSASTAVITSAPVTFSSLTPSPTPLVTSSLLPPPILPSPPLHGPPAMTLPPIIYLIAVPVALCLLLVIMIILICCIICCYRLRRGKRQRSKGHGLKGRSSGSRLDRSKSLEAYGGNGRSSHSVSKSEESTKRYELQTVDSGNRFSEASLTSPTAIHTSKTLPATNRGHTAAWSSSPHINLTSPHHYDQSPYPSTAHHHQQQHPLTSPLHSQRLRGIPESGAPNADEKYVMMMKQGKTASLPHSYSTGVTGGVLDPSSLYDVPASARGKLAGTIPDPNNPQSVYDIPKGALIASGHYNVPPLAQSVPSEGVYDVPPSSTVIYDVPPDVYHHHQNQGSEVYDVPPPMGTRPRLNSQPTSQEELLEARRSVIAATGSENVFAAGAGPDYSHYDVPRHLLISQPNMQQHYQQPGKRLSRRNSYSPSHTNTSMVYDVPRDARNAAPPTATKPSRKRNPPSRSHSINSPSNMASPEKRYYPNEVFYDVPPLDSEFLAQQHQTSTSNESGTSHLTRGAAGAAHRRGTHNVAMSPNWSDPAKKGRVPPPTKRKPGRKGESIKM